MYIYGIYVAGNWQVKFSLIKDSYLLDIGTQS